ncbi:hypothetical protein [Halohasta litorea]|uniref:Uncharacterized protein n=1 Tax=Halohasta litorea TaxID=869891 RepID=A0ABD6D5V6_9EURY|nr:hypothetical protein [Halohasta litorea]MEA1932361.1 hypothetical protein [Euryarchaeota archaeon]
MVLHNPAVRWGIGLSGGLIVIAIAFFFLSGTVQLVAYGVALLDMVVTPLILKMAAEEQ